MAFQPAPLPYRDLDNQTVNYIPGVGAAWPHIWPNSDFQPLLNSTPPNELDDDAIMRFTATGRPMPAFEHNALQSMGGIDMSLPQLLPRRYTDDSIIPAIIVNVIPSSKAEGDKDKKKRRGSFLKKLKGEKKDDGLGLVKVVFMPRRDYLQWFARGAQGEYIGTEPYKQWTEDELDETFKHYKPVMKVKKGYRPPF